MLPAVKKKKYWKLFMYKVGTGIGNTGTAKGSESWQEFPL
jgi:hypothetical protein